MNDEILIGASPVKGQRIFLLDQTKMVLRSLSGGGQMIWTPGEVVVSECGRAPAHGHVKPEPDCTCGIWSCVGRKGLHKTFPYVYGGYGNLTISAQIEQWGRVIRHDWGYRSEYARIIPETIQMYPRKHINGTQRKVIRYLREKYACLHN